MKSLYPLLSVVLTDRQQGIHNRCATQRYTAVASRSDGKNAVRFGLIKMAAAGAIPGLIIYTSDGDSVGPPPLIGMGP